MARTRTPEEVAAATNKKETQKYNPPNRPSILKPPEDDGFTLVQRKKGNGGQLERGGGSNHTHPNKHNGTRQAWAVNQGMNRDKEINGGFMYSRNIINNQARQANPENPIPNGERIRPSNLSTQPPPNEPATSNVNLKNMRQEDTGRKVDREADQSIRIVGTKNRFLVLNNDGDDIDGDRITQDRDVQVHSELETGNEGWRRRQERTLNMRFRDRVTQEQRFEAKRLIIDRLVPLESSISDWTPSTLEYFRHMCTIFNFGEGLQAVARDRFSDQENPAMELDQNDEEVFSETDGTADLMKTDAPEVHHAEVGDSGILEKTKNQPLIVEERAEEEVATYIDQEKEMAAAAPDMRANTE
ncbi:hypothetical protein L1987_32482 [Smallanthus sonchifolius]|uniref:Uncharacterized protein n=1 Tax=Smallanthus sonchifolius TaxID=185202 RepID=A0ACB9HN49_9ASTR|nr:hypothetical protein L1987_32482 [Smallanthus sonchifolius]